MELEMGDVVLVKGTVEKLCNNRFYNANVRLRLGKEILYVTPDGKFHDSDGEPSVTVVEREKKVKKIKLFAWELVSKEKAEIRITDSCGLPPMPGKWSRVPDFDKIYFKEIAPAVCCDDKNINSKAFVEKIERRFTGGHSSITFRIPDTLEDVEISSGQLTYTAD